MQTNRRELLYSLLGVSSLPGFLSGQDASSAADAPLAVGRAEAVADGVLRFFSAGEFAGFQRLGDLIMPADGNEPGALAAKAPEFLDFLLSQSPAAIQNLYRTGVHVLDKRAGKPFTRVTNAEAAKVLSPLNAPWTYTEASDPFAQFLLASKMAFWQATLNSKEWAEAGSARRRGGASGGAYWLPFE